MYIIGDIHGCYKTFRALLNQLHDWRTKRVCLTGDLCDRGPDSKSVYDFVIENSASIDCVIGNHDLMLAHTITQKNSPYYEIWKRNGMKETLDSYLKNEKIDYESLARHAAWVAELPLYIEYPDLVMDNGRYLVVSHNVVYKQWKYRDSISELHQRNFQGQVLWGTQYKHSDNTEIYNVTGHWAKKERVKGNRSQQQFCGARIKKFFACVDGGCGYTSGKLWALDFPSMKTYSQTTLDEVTW